MEKGIVSGRDHFTIKGTEARVNHKKVSSPVFFSKLRHMLTVELKATTGFTALIVFLVLSIMTGDPLNRQLFASLSVIAGVAVFMAISAPNRIIIREAEETDDPDTRRGEPSGKSPSEQQAVPYMAIQMEIHADKKTTTTTTTKTPYSHSAELHEF